MTQLQALLILVLVVLTVRMSGFQFVRRSNKHGGKVITQEDACSLLTSIMQGDFGNCWVIAPLIFLARTKYDNLSDSVLQMISDLRSQTNMCPLIPPKIKDVYKSYLGDPEKVVIEAEGGKSQWLLAAFLATLDKDPYDIKMPFDKNYAAVLNRDNADFELSLDGFYWSKITHRYFFFFLFGIGAYIKNHVELVEWVNRYRDINGTKLLGGVLNLTEVSPSGSQHGGHAIPYTACYEGTRPIITCNNWNGKCGEFDPTQGEYLEYQITGVSLVTE